VSSLLSGLSSKLKAEQDRGYTALLGLYSVPNMLSHLQQS